MGAAAGRSGLLGRAQGTHAGQQVPPAVRQIAPGPFQGTWESLKQWRMPEWFRDAKFGIWAHWTAQCVPEQGDWYGRRMYVQGEPQYEYHVKTYGHPSRFGFKDIDHLWKAERWDPERLMDLYVNAGAKYFMSLAVHHDNLDCWDSRYHHWNTTRVGPGKDIVGTWAKVVRERGLRFGVSNHSSHAWHWWQTAYGYDAEGPMAGVRYDAYTEGKAQGAGTWWDGLDPQELYTGPSMVIPDGIRSVAAMRAWHDAHDGQWIETPPPASDPTGAEFVRSWYLRCKDLMDRYDPDLVYFDDTELPLGQAGLDITADFYNSNMRRHGGRLEAVVAAKKYTPEHLGATMLDIERGRAQGILPAAWQTDTCIGDWHYDRRIFERHGYKTPSQVAQLLVDVVSKNGNLMLSIPLKGDGTIDEDEHTFLTDFAAWMKVHGEGIYGTRPFSVYGEGAPDLAAGETFGESKARAFEATDIRFTQQKDGTLYVWALGWPADGRLRVRSLAKRGVAYPGEIKAVELLGGGRIPFERTNEALVLTLPAKPEGRVEAFGFRVRG